MKERKNSLKNQVASAHNLRESSPSTNLPHRKGLISYELSII
jgi:hypothetical protein